MAITIEQQPDSYQPIHNPMMVLAASNLTTNNNFKYVFNITVGTETRVIKVSPRPSDGKGELDLSRHLKDYLNDIQFDVNTTSDFTIAPHVEYTLVVGEEWTVNGVITNGDATEPVTLVATDIVMTPQEQFNYSEFIYRTDTSAPVDAIVLLQTERFIYKDDLIFIHVAGSVGANMKLSIAEFDNANTLLNTDTTTFVSSIDEPAVHIKFDLSTYTFDSTTHYITLTIIDGSNTIATESKKLFLKPAECVAFDYKKILYREPKGSFNCINLHYENTKEINSTPDTFNKRVNYLTETSVTRGQTRYNVKSEYILKVNTGNLDYYEVSKVENLIKSDSTYLDVRQDNNFP